MMRNTQKLFLIFCSNEDQPFLSAGHTNKIQPLFWSTSHSKGDGRHEAKQCDGGELY